MNRVPAMLATVKLAQVIRYKNRMVSNVARVPKLLLNNNREIPALALGTYLGFDQNGPIKSQNKHLRNAILHAFDLGYRHIDTAAIYGTEEEVGEAVHIKICERKLQREDVFITTKLWNTQHRREQVAEGIRDSLKRLGLDYLDLYLMHWPIGLNHNYTHSNVDYMETWRGMEDVLNLGLTRSIGLSNFNKQQIERVLQEGETKPAVLQIEVHPQNIQTELVKYAQSERILVMAYSPFGSMVSRHGMMFPGPKIDDAVLLAIANKYNKTTPQVVLRWLVERQIVPVAKSTNYQRLEENIGIFDFKLSEYDMEQINKYNENIRYTLPSFWQNHPYYPFEKIENPIDDPFIQKS